MSEFKIGDRVRVRVVEAYDITREVGELGVIVEDTDNIISQADFDGGMRAVRYNVDAVLTNEDTKALRGISDIWYVDISCLELAE